MTFREIRLGVDGGGDVALLSHKAAGDEQPLRVALLVLAQPVHRDVAPHRACTNAYADGSDMCGPVSPIVSRTRGSCREALAGTSFAHSVTHNLLARCAEQRDL